jgi:ribose transport system permease protein
MTMLRHALALPAVWVLIVMSVIFTLLSPTFLTTSNLANLLVQSAVVGIAATGMTFVLATAGVDLSVGSVMFLGAALCGWFTLQGYPWWLAAGLMVVIGPLVGALHGIAITRLRVAPFAVTLASLFIARGLGLWISRTRAMNLPDDFRALAGNLPGGLPMPVVIMAVVLIVGQWVFGRTPFGRKVIAVGHDLMAARKAGIHTNSVLIKVYVISGLCSSLGGLVALSQLGAVSPTFGREREFDAIAAAVLGGASLSGGRGSVLPGALMGALTIQTAYNGLNLIDADPYVYPVVSGSIVLVAVLSDGIRSRLRGWRT